MAPPATPVLLSLCSPDVLLRAYAALTHRIHAAQMREGGTPIDAAARASLIADLREQRRLIHEEAVRRMGGDDGR